MVVQQQLNDLQIPFNHVAMGEVELPVSLTQSQQQDLSNYLLKIGFELLNDKKQQQIEQIKKLLIGIVQKNEMEEHFSISEYLGKYFNKEYSNISRLFSEVEGITVEQFFILQKTERVKELLKYNELSLSEIAWKLGYSSVAHLSSQFKRLTGLTPSAFKKMGGSRKSLDKL